MFNFTCPSSCYRDYVHADQCKDLKLSLTTSLSLPTTPGAIGLVGWIPSGLHSWPIFLLPLPLAGVPSRGAAGGGGLMLSSLEIVISCNSNLPCWRVLASTCPGIAKMLHASWYSGVPRSRWQSEPPLRVLIMRVLGRTKSRSRALIGITWREARAFVMSTLIAVSRVAGWSK